MGDKQHGFTSKATPVSDEQHGFTSKVKGDAFPTPHVMSTR